MYSRKYKIDSVTSLIEQVQMKRLKKFEKEQEEYWKPIEEELQRSGIGRGDIVLTLGVSAGLMSFLNIQLSASLGIAFMAYLSMSFIAPMFYAKNAPRLPAIKFSTDNLKGLFEYFNPEQKTEIKNILELFEIDWTIDLDNLKLILNKISEQIDKNNSTALFAEKPIDVKKIVSWYRPVVNEQRHNRPNMAHAHS